MWCSGGYDIKQKLQYLLFPEGITYNKKENSYLTLRVNSAILTMSYLARVLEDNKNGQIDDKINLSVFVPGIGVEPIRV